MGDILPQDGNEEKRIEVKMPTKLIQRVNEYCQKQNISMDNFILEAISSKLSQANQERRKRQRL